MAEEYYNAGYLNLEAGSLISSKILLEKVEFRGY